MNIISQVKSKIDNWLKNPEVHQSLKKTKWGTKVLIASVSITAIVLGIRTLGGLQTWEIATFDLLVNLRPDEPEDPRVLVVGYTEQDIEKLKSDQISDGQLAEVIQKLEESEAKVIGIDIFRDIAIGEGHQTLQQVFQSSNESNKIVVPCQMNDGKDDRGIKPPEVFNSEELQEAVAIVNVLPDQDGVLRRGLLISSPPENDKIKQENKHLCSNPEKTLSSFAFLLGTSYFPESVEIKQPEQDSKTFKYTQFLQIGKAIFKPLEPDSGGYQNLQTSDYQILLNYRSRGKASKEISVSDILTNNFKREDIKDKVVLVGYTALSRKDVFPTPYQKQAMMPGVHIHAQIVSQIISAGEGERPATIDYFPEWGEWLWILGWSIVGGLLSYPKIKSSLVFASVFITAGGLFVICWGGILFAYWLPLIPALIVFLGTSATIYGVERINIKEVDWDLIREEENKKQEQAEKIIRRRILTQLMEKAGELKGELDKLDRVDREIIPIDHNLDILLQIDSHESAPIHLTPQFNKVNKENWLASLCQKCQKIQESWLDVSVNPVEQKKASIRKLVQESEKLRASFKVNN
ncbi:CHASE2 domain-containing protein [Anabaena sp. FACHB-1237]|uniref:CHASE2 domain-containing protein n=1 Tax=Anabaena sp. FACHB-1237 TaxID=2692769 RepID=UPI001680F239|nr:CHASE2 domain-containing protein [Anabaena sp. FACHB-1237]MBD2137996.1 CHASE2 domain-containing protein [Anabaena sp. FACHB-1237]